VTFVADFGGVLDGHPNGQQKHLNATHSRLSTSICRVLTIVPDNIVELTDLGEP
jgi:hypothetical protein